MLRTLILFAPALVCAGTMFICFRMMSMKHDAHGDDHRPNRSATADVDPAERADR